jgi:hypothetical protein
MNLEDNVNKYNNYVINPLTSEELNSFLDNKSKDIIKYFIVKSLFSQPEPKLDQNQIPIQIPKEHVEQWFTQALNVHSVGAGSYPIDIYNLEQKWGADIKMLNIKIDEFGNITNSSSGEASLGQKFTGPGIDLDTWFAQKEYEKIKDSWVNLYNEKYNSIKDKYEINKIYYFFILRPGTQVEGADFYFTGAVINLDNLHKIEVNKIRTTDKSVFLNHFIDNDYGNTKIYRAKKRLELRLNPKKWIENRFSLKISTSFQNKPINLRDDYTDSYLDDRIEQLKNVTIKFIK